MAGLRFVLLQGLKKFCHPTKCFMRLMVFSSASLRHNTGFYKGEARVFHCGGHCRSLQEAPGKEKGEQGLVRAVSGSLVA